MKPFIILLFYFSVICYCSGKAQLRKTNSYSPSPFQTYRKLVITTIAPIWQPATLAVSKVKSVMTDSVFMFKNKLKSKDSVLVMVQFFDSLGHLLKRDQYNYEGGLTIVSIFIYDDGVLYRKEEARSNPVRKDITTYGYDSAGHIVTEKLYKNNNDSTQAATVTTWDREYDEQGFVTKESITFPKPSANLHRDFFYDYKGRLNEAKTIDSAGRWIYTYFHEYDEQNKTERVYKQFVGSEKKIENEYFFDNQNRLISIKNYTEGEDYLKHNTQTFFYSHGGLMEKQIYEDTERNDYYYKHFYTYYTK